MSASSSKPKRRMGCLPRLLIFALLMGVCYWLLLAPLPASNSDQTTGTGPPELPSERVSIDGEVNPEQRAALEKLAEASGAQADVLSQNGQIQYLTVDVKVPDTVAVSAQEKALYFLQEHEAIYKLGALPQAVRFVGKTNDSAGNTIIRFIQQYQGVPVNGSNILFSFDKDRNIFSVIANYAPGLEISVSPKIRSIKAEDIALQDISAVDRKVAAPTNLEIYAPEIWLDDYPGVNLQEFRRLAWLVTIKSENEKSAWTYVIDAENGEILEANQLGFEFAGQINLEILKSEGGHDKVVVKEKDGKVEILDDGELFQNVYNNIKYIHQYYFNNFERDGYNNDGKVIKIYVQLDCDANGTAGWHPTENFMSLCTAWSKYPDVIYHEYTHAVVDSMMTAAGNETAKNLAVGEALADSFAVFSSQEAYDAIWQISGPPDNTVYRDLKNPQTDYPKHYNERYADRNLWKRIKSPSSLLLRVCPSEIVVKEKPEKVFYKERYSDCGHINSLILSYATYLMSSEADPVNGIPLKNLQFLYYQVLASQKVQTSTNLKQAAHAIAEICHNLADKKELPIAPAANGMFTSKDCQKVEQAFGQVGLLQPKSSSGTGNAPTPPSTAATPAIQLTPTVPAIPVIPNPLDWFKDLPQKVRQAVDELLGDWSPFKIWDRIQEVVNKIRNNDWVKLMECVKNSDQACVDRYINTIIEELLTAFVNALCNSCPLSFMLPMIGIVLSRRRWKKSKYSNLP